jgi:aspartyl protease family protein
MSSRHFISLLAVFFAVPAAATDVTVVGLFSNKAVVQINGGAARTLSIGQKTQEGVTLVSVERERDTATLQVDGRPRTLKLGQHHAAAAVAGSSAAVKLAADGRGHYIVDGQVNGGAVRFVLDTGATLVSLSSDDAQRLGIDYRAGKPGVMNTANGQTRAWRVTLDSVRVGDITLNHVEGAVLETPGMPPLLGMSFLNRTDMRREGEVLTLTRRF